MSKYYVITKMFNNKKHYFKYETVGAINPKTQKVERWSVGIFSPYRKDAKIYPLQALAEIIASSYEGTEIEEIEI